MRSEAEVDTPQHIIENLTWEVIANCSDSSRAHKIDLLNRILLLVPLFRITAYIFSCSCLEKWYSRTLHKSTFSRTTRPIVYYSTVEVVLSTFSICQNDVRFLGPIPAYISLFFISSECIDTISWWSIKFLAKSVTNILITI
jgi:hypothetical protein